MRLWLPHSVASLQPSHGKEKAGLDGQPAQRGHGLRLCLPQAVASLQPGSPKEKAGKGPPWQQGGNGGRFSFAPAVASLQARRDMRMLALLMVYWNAA